MAARRPGRSFSTTVHCLPFRDWPVFGPSLRVLFDIARWDGRVDAVSRRLRKRRRHRIVLVISIQGHVVDALAAGGDEGRRSLRKASGSGQARDDPEMSEWGNPAVG